MDDRHLTRELFRAVMARELHPRSVADLALQHLLDLCPTCHQEFEAWQQEREVLARSLDYSGTFNSLMRTLDDQTQKLSREDREAAHDLKRLLDLPSEERAAAVKRARRHFRGQGLARLLLRESLRQIPRDPGEAFRLAELAREVVNHSPAAPGGFDLLALISAYMANARRASGQLREADSLFAFARFLIRRDEVSDLEVLARVDDLEGSLRKDQRRLRDAEDLLRRAAKLYRSIGDHIAEARVLVKLGSVQNQNGDQALAIATTEAALGKLEQRSDSRLFVCARYNLAYFHLLSGAHETSAAILEADAALYQESPEPGFVLRYLWLEGNIAEARGDFASAEEGYRKTREGFLLQGIGYDAAIVSLDLTILFLKTGRMAEVRRLAEEMFPIFEAQDVHREALAALMLFQESARREEITIASVQEVARYLRDARSDPEYKFRIPS